MGKTVRLIQVTESNNNKFYNMEELSDGSWKATWGRVGSAGSTKTYQSYEWNKKYNEKLSKGYSDVTELVSVAKAEKEYDLKVQNSDVKSFVEFLQKCAKQTIKDNYLVDVSSVTQLQLDTAQSIVDHLVTLASHPLKINLINSKLLELYKTIPRKMSKVNNYLLNSPNFEFFQKLLDNEQKLLDTLSTQVSNNKVEKKDVSVQDFGLDIEIASDEDRERISKETDFKLTSKHRVFKVTNHKTEKNFANKKGKLLYHGSRNENWWSILQTGLRIRPSGVIVTGSMFGASAIYFASKARKSLGYTSLRGSYWASGSSNKAYLALFDVYLGKQWKLIDKNTSYQSWMSSLDYKKVRDKGYDSTFAKGGADLVNDEYMIYTENQCTIRYIIEITN